MLARVGFEMAWFWRVCWSWQATGAALGSAVRVAVDGTMAAELLVARTMEVRSMAAGGVEIVEKNKKRKEEIPVEGPTAANGWWW
jgi:hypothetical protein